MANITISNVTKSFGDVLVLKEFNEVFNDKEFITLLGPSGCGKTTMLRMIAGFEKPSSGEIKIDDTIVSSDKVFLPPEKRNIGMVFQSYAVWPHMTVFDNVAYPLKIKKVDRETIRKKVTQTLEVVHLAQYANRIPSQLSGGQQQRVALARALAAEPQLLLLDEPLSNLDAKLRESMRFEIKEIQEKLGITVVYVTHDQTEAMAMSDRIVVLNRGIVQQIGSPQEIYNNPANPFVADFVGKIDFLKGHARGSVITLDGTNQQIPNNSNQQGNVLVAIRPELINISKEPSMLEGTLQSQYFLGDVNDCVFSLGNETTLRVIADPFTHSTMKPGEKLYLDVRSYMVFPDEEEDDFLKILT